jgi:hypothetical protein
LDQPLGTTPNHIGKQKNPGTPPDASRVKMDWESPQNVSATFGFRRVAIPSLSDTGRELPRLAARFHDVKDVDCSTSRTRSRNPTESARQRQLIST